MNCKLIYSHISPNISSELIPNQSGHVDQMTRDQICQLWPIQFMIIDQEWALLLATNNDDEDVCIYLFNSGSCFEESIIHFNLKFRDTGLL